MALRKKMCRRISAFSAALLIAGTSVFSGGFVVTGNGQIEAKAEEVQATSWSAGSEAIATLDTSSGKNVIRISGSGEVELSYDVRQEIEKLGSYEVVIEEGITRIGAYAFSYSPYDENFWICMEGRVDFGYNGNVTDENGTWNVVGGKVVRT